MSMYEYVNSKVLKVYRCYPTCNYRYNYSYITILGRLNHTLYGYVMVGHIYSFHFFRIFSYFFNQKLFICIRLL